MVWGEGHERSKIPGDGDVQVHHGIVHVFTNAKSKLAEWLSIVPSMTNFNNKTNFV